MKTFPKENLVSIIIPTHNRSKLLTETLLSALNQDHSSVEIIIIDDNSTDDTPKVMEDFLRAYPYNNIQFIKNEGEGGCCARNTGIRHAKGEYIQFFDDDDIMEPNFISYRLNILKEKRLDFVTCDYDCFKEDISNIVGEKRISNGYVN